MKQATRRLTSSNFFAGALAGEATIPRRYTPVALLGSAWEIDPSLIELNGVRNCH